MSPRDSFGLAYLAGPQDEEFEMSYEPILPSIAAIRAGDHYCGIYRTDEDRHALLIDFLREGLLRNEKMLYVVDLHGAAKLKGVLATAEIAIEPLLDTGQLVIVTGRDYYVSVRAMTP